MKKKFKWLEITLIVLIVLAFTVACSKDDSLSQDDMLEEANYFLFMGDSLSALSVSKTNIGVLFKGPDLPSSWESDLNSYVSQIESIANEIIDYPTVPKSMKKIHKEHVNGMNENILATEKFILGIENMDDDMFGKALKHLKKGDKYIDKGGKLLDKYSKSKRH